MNSTTISIVIPTYNEEADIKQTLDSLAQLLEPSYEILVVDASSDATPKIVDGYPSNRVRLIRQSRGRGRSAARNEGILEARGDIVVVLNADVSLPRDFVNRIMPHYQAGADYLLVESKVSNTDCATGRYVQALHEAQYSAAAGVDAKMNWTEGFSCRRSAAIDVGLIPEGDIITLVAGEDGWFGEKLAAAGYRKVIDRSIVVTHIIPPDLAGFWHQRVGRGQGTAQIWYLRDGWRMGKVIRAATILSVMTAAALALPLPSAVRAVRLCNYSPLRWRDWPIFFALDWLESAANICGIWLGVQELRRAGAR